MTAPGAGLRPDRPPVEAGRPGVARRLLMAGGRRRRGLLALAAGGLLIAGAAQAACREPGLPQETRCGSVERPLDPARPDGPRIAVHYIVVPALARQRHEDPVVLLAGGPGQSAIALAPALMPLFSTLNHRRDLLFVDQRGTGRSAPLTCPSPAVEPLAAAGDPALRTARLRDCLARLQALPHGDLRQYTTTIAMADLEAVRQALGAPRLNLVGASYGTRAALEYQRQFPQAVRRMVLDGVAPPDMVLPASASPDAQAAFDAMLAACEADAGGCARRFPTLRADVARLLASLPRDLAVPHPLTGAPDRLRLDRRSLLQLLRGPLYAPAIAAALPQAIHDAARGREAPLAGLASLGMVRGPAAVAAGQHLSVLCAEDLPRMSTAAEPPGADFGDALAADYLEACAVWPRGEVPTAFYTIPPAPQPVLLLSGGLDPVTPPRHAGRTAAALGPKAVHRVAPHAGHGVLSLPCGRELLSRFIEADDDAAALAIEADCLAGVPRPPAFESIGREAAP